MSQTEHVKALIAWNEGDQKVVLMWIVFDLAIISLTLSEKLFNSKSWLVAIGLFSFLGSAVFLNLYHHKGHLAGRELAGCLAVGATNDPGVLLENLWKKNKAQFRIGIGLMLLGILLLLCEFALGVMSGV